MAAIAAPAIGFGPVGWAIGGAVVVGGLLLAAANNNNNNNGSIPDNHNRGNPNNRGPNGPEHPFYYHEVRGKSRKDAFNRALNDGYGNTPIDHGDHFHASRMRGGELFKFGNTHYRW